VTKLRSAGALAFGAENVLFVGDTKAGGVHAYEFQAAAFDSQKDVFVGRAETFEGLWDREQKRLTVLFDPGRIKRGVGPYLAAGPPLVEGETYTFRVGPGMRDARGRVLTGAFEKIFVAVAPEPERLDPRRWTIQTPSRGSREPLRVETAVHIDSGAFGGAIRIVTDKGETVAGTASLLPGAPAWQFIPDRDWLPGRYRIEVRTEVEDVSGNSVQSAFDAIAGRSVSLRDEQLLLSFEIGGS
jgi:hypothetical protein